MPAAAKIEKPAAATAEMTNGKGKNASKDTNGSANNNTNNASNVAQDPQKIANTIIEKKVRNLEKRKTRLLEIKALEDKGQQLEADQKIAVKKLDGVIEMIDILKEIGKNVTDGLSEYSKQMKKQQKREQIEKQAERQHQDAERTKLWLNAQFILSRFALAKNDLLNGENGAVKLEENQVDALEKMAELLSPSSVELIESSVEKVNLLLEGNKREFITGVSYLALKETLIKLIDSKYFETLTTVNNTTTTNTSTPVSGTPSPADKEESPKVEQIEPVSVVSVPSHNDSQEKPVQVKQQQPPPQQQPLPQQPVQQQPQQQNAVHSHHQLNQLCFMRDPIVENELQHKDPAVVAVGASGFAAYQAAQLGQAMPVSSGSNIATSNTISSHYSPHMYPAVSIPTQTYTNPSYTALMPSGANQFIPVTMATQMPTHPQMPIPEQALPIRNVVPSASPILKNERNQVDQSAITNEQFITEGGSPKEASNMPPSQESEGKPVVNGQAENGNHGQYKPRNHNRGGGGGRGNPRGNYGGNPNGGGSIRGGRGGKNYGGPGGASGGGGANFFNGGSANNAQNGGGNYNPNRGPANNNRQNGGGNRSGPYRQGGAPRNPHFNNNNNNQGAPVSAK